jgi:hypothetical protein
MSVVMKTVFTGAAFLVLISVSTFAQTTPKDVGSREQIWLAYFNQTRLTNKFGLWLDVHYRRTDNFVERPFQLMFRPALTWFITNNLRANAGYAFVNHFPAKNLETSRPEHRSWQQIWWNQKYTGLTMLQWLRLEQRFNRKIANDVLEDGYNYGNRVRYNISFSIPLKGKELVKGTPFISVANELFVNFGDKVVYNTFDQNRFSVSIAYQINANTNAQLGYLNVFQQEAAGNKYMISHGVRLFVLQNIDLRSN